MEYDYSKTIIRLRAILNITKEQLAKMLNGSLSIVNRCERGRFAPTKLIKVMLEDLFVGNN